MMIHVYHCLSISVLFIARLPHKSLNMCTVYVPALLRLLAPKSFHLYHHSPFTCCFISSLSCHIPSHSITFDHIPSHVDLHTYIYTYIINYNHILYIIKLYTYVYNCIIILQYIIYTSYLVTIVY